MLLSLINEVVGKPADVDGAVCVVKILQCYGPHGGVAIRVALDHLLDTFGNAPDADLRRQTERLRTVADADRRGLARPVEPGIDRCDWIRRLGD